MGNWQRLSQFVFIILLAVCGGLATFWACSSDSDTPTGDVGHQRYDLDVVSTTGLVILPVDISDLADSVTVTTSLGKGDCSDTGSFSIPVYEGGSQLGVALTPGGSPMMMGWLSSSRHSISGHTTAQVLLYYALGGFALPSSAQENILDVIESSDLADTLGGVIDSVLAEDPDAIANGDSTIMHALHALVTDFLVPIPVGTSRPDESLARTLGIVVNPPQRLSGVSVDLTAGINRFRLVNEFRRRAHLFVDRVSYRNSGGQDVTSDSMIAELAVRPVQGVSSLTNTLTDLWGGNVAYAPETTATVYLPMVDSAQSVRYRLALVGPGMGDGDLADLTSVELNQQQFVSTQFVIGDVFVPMVLSILLPNSSIDDYLEFVGGGGVLTDFMNAAVAQVPQIATLSAQGDIAGASREVWILMRDSNTFRSLVLQGIMSWVQSTYGVAAADAAYGNAQVLLNALGAVDLFLSVFDMTAIGYGIGQSNRADIWTAAVTPAPVNLTPDRAKVSPGESVTLHVDVPDASGTGAVLAYEWQSTGTSGTLSDGTQADRIGFTSTRDSVVYTADDTTGYDVITVVVSLIEGTSARTEIGEASAKMTVVQPTVILSPDNRTIGHNDRLVLRATMINPPSDVEDLTYHWQCTNAFGTVSDGTFSGGAAEYYSGSDTAVYISNPSGDGSDLVTVTVYSGFGGIDERALSSDTARVFVESSIFGFWPDSVEIQTLKQTGFRTDITVPGGLEDISYHWRCSGENGDLQDTSGVGEVNDFWNESGYAVYTSRYNDYGSDSVWLDIYQQQGDTLVLMDRFGAVVVIGGPREYKLYGPWDDPYGNDDKITAKDYLIFSWDNVSGFEMVTGGYGGPFTIRASKGDTLYWFAYQLPLGSTGCQQVSPFWVTDYTDTVKLCDGVDNGCSENYNPGYYIYFLHGQYVFPY